MPTGIVPVLIAVAILVAVGAGISWVIAHPAIVAVAIVAIVGVAVLLARRKRARDQV